MEVLFTIVFILLSIWFISRNSFFRLEGISDNWLYGLFLLKVFCGFLLWVVYTRYYPVRQEADIFKYFDDSKILFDALFSHPADFFRMFFGFGNDFRLKEMYFSRMQVWSPRFENSLSLENHTMIRLNVLFRLVSGGYYQVHNVLINLLSFSGLIAICKVFSGYVPRRRKLLFCSVCLLPSVLFWGSGLMKESFALFATGFSIYYFLNFLLKGASRKSQIRVLAFLLLLLMIKTLIGVLVIIGFAAWYLSVKFQRWSAIWNFLGLIVILVAGLVLLARYSSYDYFYRMLTKQTDQLKIARGGVWLRNSNRIIYLDYDKNDAALMREGDSVFTVKPGSAYCYFNWPDSKDTFYVKNSSDTLKYKLVASSKPAGTIISIPRLTEHPLSFIQNSPMAVWNVLNSPNLFKKNKGVQLAAALQNAFIFLILVPCLFFINKTQLRKPELLFCILLSIGYFILIGLVIPIPGTLDRLKISVLPFLMILIVMLIDSRLSNIRSKKPLSPHN